VKKEGKMPSRGKHGLFGLGMLFLLIGVIWMQAIYQRCEVIYPASQRVADGVTAGSGQGGQKIDGGENGEKSVTKEPAAEKQKFHLVRSPAARDYHFIFFWSLTIWEAAAAFLYVISGLMILRKFAFAPGLGLVAVSVDLGFKLAAITYMQFCAIPLAAATGNPNLILAYFQPARDGWAWFSGLMSGLSIYNSHTRPDIIIVGCFILFSYRVLLKNCLQKD